jgi:hypothetical protein
MSERPRRSNAAEWQANTQAGLRYQNAGSRKYGIIISEKGDHAAFRVKVGDDNYMFNVNDHSGQIYDDGFIKSKDYRPLVSRNTMLECAPGRGSCVAAAAKFKEIYDEAPGTPQQKLSVLTRRLLAAPSVSSLLSNSQTEL